MQNFEGFEPAAEWIEQKVNQASPKIIEHDGRPYILDYKGLTPILEPKYPCVEATTLTGLIDFVKFRGFGGGDFRTYIHVVSPTQVRLMHGEYGPFNQADCFMNVNALTPRVVLNTFIDQENFIIQAQACFVNTPDLEKIMAVAGNIRDQIVKDTCDDGVSQVATVKSGVARLSDVVIPRQVLLAPIRTFPEVRQPASNFVYRIQDGPRMVLLEADGGAWRNEAMQDIKAYLDERIGDKITIIA